MSDEFQDHMNDELNECENFLHQSGAYDSVPQDIEIRSDECYQRYGERGGEYWKKICNIIGCYERLAIIYKYFGKDEKANKMFGFVSSINLPKSKFGYLNEETRKDWQAMDALCRKQIEKGAQLNLADKDTDIAHELFNWASEDLFQSEEIIEGQLKYEQYNLIASWYLWRAYALIILGKYEDAYGDLSQVVPYYTLNKKHGGETYEKLEYHLTKALIPLCEYELDPSVEGRENARRGIETFINSFGNMYEKFDAYLYYFHLKKVFPMVYGEPIISNLKQHPVRDLSVLLRSLRPLPSNIDIINAGDKKHFISITTSDRIYDENFGSDIDLEHYIGKIKVIGDYPILSNLMDLYVGESEQEPEPLIEECEKILLVPGLDEEIKKRTGQILNVARAAKEDNSSVIIEYVDMSDWPDI